MIAQDPAAAAVVAVNMLVSLLCVVLSTIGRRQIVRGAVQPPLFLAPRPLAYAEILSGIAIVLDLGLAIFAGFAGAWTCMVLGLIWGLSFIIPHRAVGRWSAQRPTC